MSNRITMESLPTEIVNHCLSFLPKDSLRNLRLTSKYYCQQVTPYLFRQLTLRNCDESANRVNKFMKSPFACLVHHICFDASLAAWETSPQWPIHFIPLVMGNLYRFRYLDSLSIRFDRISHPACSDEECFKLFYFSEIFRVICLSLANCRVNRHKILRLSIENFPSLYDPYKTAPLGFAHLIHKLHTLELDIITIGRDDLFTRTRWMCEETVSCYQQLPQAWLEPAAHNLRTLQLSADIPWGWYLKVDFRSIYFPCLKALKLVRFTFSHDWQVQWLSDHADSLKHLTLTECAILDHATSTRQRFDSEGYPLGLEPDEDEAQGQGSYSYKKRWSYHFKAIETSLTQLESFRLLAFDQTTGATVPQSVFTDEAALTPKAHRYLTYRSIEYSPLFNDQDRSVDEAQTDMLSKDEKKQQDKEDEKALRELLATTKRRFGA